MTCIIPVNITFVEWAEQLRLSFPTQIIPRVKEESDWRKFNSMLQSNRCFEDSYLPNVDGFVNWQDWASQVMLSVGA